MTATRLVYHVWDDETGNVIAKYGTQAEAVDFLRGMLEANGESGVSNLVVIKYPADGSPPVHVLDGADFLAQHPVPA